MSPSVEGFYFAFFFLLLQGVLECFIFFTVFPAETRFLEVQLALGVGRTPPRVFGRIAASLFFF